MEDVNGPVPWNLLRLLSCRSIAWCGIKIRFLRFINNDVFLVILLTVSTGSSRCNLEWSINQQTHLVIYHWRSPWASGLHTFIYILFVKILTSIIYILCGTEEEFPIIFTIFYKDIFVILWPLPMTMFLINDKSCSPYRRQRIQRSLGDRAPWFAGQSSWLRHQYYLSH